MIRLLNSFTVHSAPLATTLARYPILIFAITPTYSSDVVVFPDGRVADATPTDNLNNAANLQLDADQRLHRVRAGTADR
jgi:hypothetical protein